MSSVMFIVKALLVITPILLVLVLLLKVKMQTHMAALIGLGTTILIALLFFNTSPMVAVLASGQGVLLSLPISMMTLFSILQVAFMESTGALNRISVFLKTLVPQKQEAQVMILNLSAGTTLVSLGATPVSVMPPILRDLGYSKRMCIALPALGFDALCTYSMMAAPLITYTDLTGVSLVEAAKVFSAFLPIVSTLVSFAMLYLIGKLEMVRRGFMPALLTGLTVGGVAYAIAHVQAFQAAIILTGVIAGIVSILVMMLYLKLSGEVIIDRSVLSEGDLMIERSMSLAKALSPWIILLVCLLIVAFVPPIDQLLRIDLATPLSILPGSVTNIRPFWNAYFWVLISTILSIAVLKPMGSTIQISLKKWLTRAPKPVLSAILFFMLGSVLNASGLQLNPEGGVTLVDQMDNMVSVLSQATANLVGHSYPLVAAPLGLFGGFITSSEASALAMFAKYNQVTAQTLGINALILTAATGIGAGLASVISPAKLQNAAATIDALGEENEVLKSTGKIALLLVIVVAIMTAIFIALG